MLGSFMGRFSGRPLGRFLGCGLAIGAFACVVLATPFLLVHVAPTGLDWGRLSNIAQVYGAVSVLVSTAALVGVVVSLFLQARQAHAAQEEASWASHRELVLLAMNDPTLIASWDPPRASNPDEWRQIAYTNLIVTGWDKAFRLGRITSEQLPMVLDKHFRGQMARVHWEAAREDWMRIANKAKGRRVRQFASIMDARYQLALTQEPAIGPENYFTSET